MIVVNLPVTDLPRARGFDQALGFTIGERLSDETAACAVISGTIRAMILTHPKYAQVTSLPITDKTGSSSHLLALSPDDRAGVDAFAAAALAAGGSEPRPVRDLGFMDSRAISDPDGHTWAPFFMDMSAMPGAAA
jgi:hypothetical protein